MSKKDQHAVRIIAGDLKGRRLSYPDRGLLRPTMQRTRESLFDVIGGRVGAGVFVDLFAAAGGIGIEAISRGASLVHFVENQQAALDCLEKNLEACGIQDDRYRIHPYNVEEFLDSGALEGQPVRIVYADPPYGEDLLGTVVAHFEKNVYAHFESLILEHRGVVGFDQVQRLCVEKTKRYGDTFLTFLRPR